MAFNKVYEVGCSEAINIERYLFFIFRTRCTRNGLGNKNFLKWNNRFEQRHTKAFLIIIIIIFTSYNFD
ncbi:hypothetical protein SAMN03159437_02622 [Pseudomonas sp. NFACC25]|nr:hypothetical protein SAMN03159437_02622 [Pseudomonas sp. NFACC25]